MWVQTAALVSLCYQGRPEPLTTNLREPTAGPPSASFKPSTRPAETSSTTFAQTADRQATLTTPERSDTGCASSAITGPATSSQQPCSRASVVAGTGPAAAPPRASAP